MARLIVEQMISANGAAQDAEGGMTHAPDDLDESACDAAQLDRMRAIDAIVLGANTYAMFSSFWPTATTTDDVMADLINRAPKHVISNALYAAPWGEHSPAHVESGDGVESVRRLKQRYGGEIVVWGSLTLADSLFLAGEVDVLRLRQLPTLAGGRTALPAGFPTARLRLVDVRSFDAGQVTSEYEVLRS